MFGVFCGGAQAGRVEGTPYPSGKAGWGWAVIGDSSPQTPTNSTFVLASPLRGPQASLAAHRTALKGVSSLCPNCPLVLRAELWCGGPEALRHLWEGILAGKPRSEHLGVFEAAGPLS